MTNYEEIKVGPGNPQEDTMPTTLPQLSQKRAPTTCLQRRGWAVGTDSLNNRPHPAPNRTDNSKATEEPGTGVAFLLGGAQICQTQLSKTLFHPH